MHPLLACLCVVLTPGDEEDEEEEKEEEEKLLDIEKNGWNKDGWIRKKGD